MKCNTSLRLIRISTLSLTALNLLFYTIPAPIQASTLDLDPFTDEQIVSLAKKQLTGLNEEKPAQTETIQEDVPSLDSVADKAESAEPMLQEDIQIEVQEIPTIEQIETSAPAASAENDSIISELQPLSISEDSQSQKEQQVAAENNLTEPEVVPAEISEIDSSDEIAEVHQEELVSQTVSAPNAYMHAVRPMAAAEFRNPWTSAFLNTIRSGSNILYYSGDDGAADLSLGEVIYDYCALPSGGTYYLMQDSTGKYLELDDREFPSLYQAVLNADAQWEIYSGQVADALNHLNLNTTDRDLVNQINQYICANYSYQIINIASMPLFMNQRIGQCWHYSKLFADMCNSAGIPAWKVEDATHAWNQVIVDGTTYTFDPTYNDTSGNWTAYSWMAS